MTGRKPLRVLFVTSVSHSWNACQLNHFQRVYLLSRDARLQLDILTCRDSDFSVSHATPKQVWHASMAGKAGVMVHFLRWWLTGRLRDYDLILTEPSLLSLCGWWARLTLHMPWVMDIWDIPIRCYLGKGLAFWRCRISRRLVQRCLRQADLFLLSIRPDFELRAFHLPAAKQLLLPNALMPADVLRQRPAPDMAADVVSMPAAQTATILCMRSVHTADMGLDTLAQAFVCLRQRGVSARLVIVGEIPAEVAAQVADLQGRDDVSFTGLIPHQQLERLIRACCVCVVPFQDVPDLSQTYPVKVLEYMAEGKAMLVSDIAGMRTLVQHEHNGLCFPAGDAMALAEGMQRLLQDDALRQRLSRQAQKDARRDTARDKNRRIADALLALLSHQNHTVHPPSA